MRQQVRPGAAQAIELKHTCEVVFAVERIKNASAFCGRKRSKCKKKGSVESSRGLLWGPCYINFWPPRVTKRASRGDVDIQEESTLLCAAGCGRDRSLELYKGLSNYTSRVDTKFNAICVENTRRASSPFPCLFLLRKYDTIVFRFSFSQLYALRTHRVRRTHCCLLTYCKKQIRN